MHIAQVVLGLMPIGKGFHIQFVESLTSVETGAIFLKELCTHN